MALKQRQNTVRLLKDRVAILDAMNTEASEQATTAEADQDALEQKTLKALDRIGLGPSGDARGKSGAYPTRCVQDEGKPPYPNWKAETPQVPNCPRKTHIPKTAQQLIPKTHRSMTTYGRSFRHGRTHPTR